MAKKDLVLFLILAIVLLFIFSPAFSMLQEFLFGEKGFEQRRKELRKAGQHYWNEEHRLEKYLEKEVPKE